MSLFMARLVAATFMPFQELRDHTSEL